MMIYASSFQKKDRKSQWGINNKSSQKFIKMAIFSKSISDLLATCLQLVLLLA